MPVELSHEEVERMRQIVQQHDAARKPMRTIDLNNPPREPYRYQKFPKMVYDLASSRPGHLVTKIVRSDNELALALEEGFSEDAPPFGSTPEEHLSASYQTEVAQLETRLAEARKRGPGRPPKVA